MLPVLGELLWFVQDDCLPCERPCVCFPDDGATLDQKCKVVQTRLMP